MSIATRINAIEEHIGNAYDKLDDLGIDSSNVDKNIENIAEMLEEVYEEYPKVTGTGTEVTLDGTKVGKLGLDVKGNSTQDGTPAPDNEVPILSAGDNGTISEKIVNKNFCKITSVTPYYYTSGLPSTQSTTLIIDSFDSNNISFHTTTNAYNIVLSNIYQLKPNTQYIIKFSRTTTATNNQWFIYNYDNGTYSINYRDNNTNTLEKTFTTNSLGQIALAFGHGNVTGTTTISNIQIEQGSTATTYTAHQEQTYTIPVQQPFRSIGDVRDEFIKVNGEWKERHNIGSAILDGTQGTFSKPSTNRFNIDNAITDYMHKNNETTYVSNLYECYNQKYNNADFNTLVSNVNYGLNFSSGAGASNIRIKDTRYDNIDDFKTWLSNNNLKIIYELETPTDLPCTEEQIAILENLPKSYNEQTNIYSLDVTPAYIEAKALKGE